MYALMWTRKQECTCTQTHTHIHTHTHTHTHAHTRMRAFTYLCEEVDETQWQDHAQEHRSAVTDDDENADDVEKSHHE